MSATALLSWPTEPNTLGQLFGGNRDTHYIVRCIGELAQTIEESKRLQDSRIDPDAHRRISPLHSLQRRTACKGTLSDDARRQSPAAPRVANVLAELAKLTTHGNGGAMRSGHL